MRAHARRVIVHDPAWNVLRLDALIGALPRRNGIELVIPEFDVFAHPRIVPHQVAKPQEKLSGSNPSRAAGGTAVLCSGGVWLPSNDVGNVLTTADPMNHLMTQVPWLLKIARVPFGFVAPPCPFQRANTAGIPISRASPGRCSAR